MNININVNINTNDLLLLRRLLDFSEWMSGLAPGTIHVGFLVDRMALGRFS
jgi:hypothetical protein